MTQHERRVYDEHDEHDTMHGVSRDAADNATCVDASCTAWAQCAVYGALRAMPRASTYDADVRGICAVNDADNDAMACADCAPGACATCDGVPCGVVRATRCDVCDDDADVCTMCHVCPTCTAHDATCADAVPCAACNGDVLNERRDVHDDAAQRVTWARGVGVTMGV